MELKVGDIVEFKKYEDMTKDEKTFLLEEFFPKYGKVKKIKEYGYFFVEHCGFVFNPKSVKRVISNADDADINSLNPGDEVLVKATVKKVFNGFIQIEPSVDKTDVVDILKRKEPEHFIVKEDHYGMYIGPMRELVREKVQAKIYTSRDTAVKDAAEVLTSWEVIPYGD